MNRRRGSVLLIVLVTVMLLALGAYTFSETMVSERAATEMYGRKVMTRLAADSGVEYVATLLGRPDGRRMNFDHNPSLFQGILMQPSDQVHGRVRFSVVAPVVGKGSSTAIRFGLVDESGRLNLNIVLPKLRQRLRDEGEVDRDQERTNEQKEAEQALARQRLLYLPGMTHKIADAILDWLDEDDLPRQYGAEQDYYSRFGRRAKNGPIDSLDELLQIRGIDPRLLFGEDANRNGLLDPNENDGERSPPIDNGDGILQVGWSGYLTVHSRETNLAGDGEPRINVNHSSLEKLGDWLLEVFGREAADFILAYRQFGPSVESGPANDGGTPTDNEQVSETSTTESRGEIQSLYDLIGSRVVTEKGGAIESPWSGDAASIREVFAELSEKLATSNDSSIEGRININQARWEVLIGIPGMSQQVATAIVNARSLARSVTESAAASSSRSTSAWLVAEGIVDLETMRQLDPHVTARGDVVRLQVVGHFDRGGPSTRIEAVIDSTRRPPKVVSLRDLSELGLGFDTASLVPIRSE